MKARERQETIGIDNECGVNVSLRALRTEEWKAWVLIYSDVVAKGFPCENDCL